MIISVIWSVALRIRSQKASDFIGGVSAMCEERATMSALVCQSWEAKKAARAESNA
jgi:hypothetical protein